MKFLISIAVMIAAAFAGVAGAQQRRTVRIARTVPVAARAGEKGQPAVVVDETLSVLRVRPSLFSESIQRLRRGHKIQILGIAEADGVKFFRVAVPPARFGWIQSEAVFGRFRPADEQRLAELVRATKGFEQIEDAIEFFKLYPDSKFKPPILLLFGDLLEEVAVKLTKDATSKLKRAEMAASGAPLHSYYLNYVSLDRYRKLGITFLFNSWSKTFHYDGASWKEVVAKSGTTAEADEARNRLDSLKSKMERPATTATQ